MIYDYDITFQKVEAPKFVGMFGLKTLVNPALTRTD